MNVFALLIAGTLAGQVAEPGLPDVDHVPPETRPLDAASPLADEKSPAIANEDDAAAAKTTPDEASGADQLPPEDGPPPRNAPEDATVEPTRIKPGAVQPLIAVRPRSRRRTPQRLLATMLKGQPPGVGQQPLSLAEAVRRTADTPRLDGQIAAVQAYWETSAALVVLHDEQSRASRLGRLEARLAQGSDEADGHRSDLLLVQAARLETEAAKIEARGRLVETQNRLARQCGFLPGDRLPVPTDLPYTGAYETRFASLSASRAIPARLRHIVAVLPLEQQQIERLAAAVQAAEDAVTASEESFAGRHGSVEVVLAAIETLSRQRRQFADVVRRYNDHIAEYAILAVPVADVASRVDMLIRRKPAAAGPAWHGITHDHDETPAVFEKTSSAAEQKSTTNTVDAGKDAASAAGVDDDAAALDAGSLKSESNRVADDLPDAGEVRPLQEGVVPGGLSIGADEGALAPSTADNAAGEQALAEPPRPGDVSHAGTTALYPGLVDADAKEQLAALVEWLYWEHEAPDGPLQPATLEACLRQSPVFRRPTVVAAYWKARGKAAAYEVMRWQVEQLDLLTPKTIELRHLPDMPEAMLRLRAARLAAEADRLAAREALLTACSKLTASVETTKVHAAWLFPATPPPRPRRDAPASGAAGQAEEGRIGWLVDLLQSRAACVVAEDHSRSAAENRLGPDAPEVDRCREAIERQSRATLALLHRLTDYNIELARVTLRHSPPGLPAHELALRLVSSQTDARAVRGPREF